MQNESDMQTSVQNTSAKPSRGRIAISALLFIDFVITAVILVTDKNLQTDFGTTPKYFLHWDALALTAIVDLVGGVIVLALNARIFTKLAAAWSTFMILFLLADVATYHLVGFSTPGQFASYLFGITMYSGTTAGSYIPGLYDLLLGFYVVTAAYAFIRG